ncbi:hypothetical protein HB162lentus_28480 [Mammaliicoccus lentus]
MDGMILFNEFIFLNWLKNILTIIEIMNTLQSKILIFLCLLNKMVIEIQSIVNIDINNTLCVNKYNVISLLNTLIALIIILS